MSKKLIIVTASLFFALGLIQIMDWIIFCDRPGNDGLPMAEFYAKYLDRLPPLLQGYFRYPVVSTLACMLFFMLAGLLFLRLKKKPYRMVAIFTFVLAFWQLFTLM
ncbi:MAG TPA: hypothetical protein VF008_11875 [Niastella sp.]